MLYRMVVPTKKSKEYLANYIHSVKKHEWIEDVEITKPRIKKELCRFFINKACNRGDACTYSHDIEKFLCKDSNCKIKNCMGNHKEEEEIYVSPFD
ncbi:Zinc finger protein [Spraguea lophii 42_110]|uniref:Zinc finger protein n=1 Tax=Spraguea lophii (strain 42_110) TaxID=1358809 RepID=S7W9U8_SPRLO|nr:Zinc finger protein [Spraguea lophii 42_110]